MKFIHIQVRVSLSTNLNYNKRLFKIKMVQVEDIIKMEWKTGRGDIGGMETNCYKGCR